MNIVNPEIVEQFSKFTVLVIGDVMVDQYIWGKVDRISPEAPVPIVQVTKREERLGGAANVALNLKKLGANTIIASVIGNDIRAKKFKDLCNENGIKIDGLIQTNTRQTTAKTRIIGHSQHLLRVDEENDTPINNQDETLLINQILKILENNDVSAIIFEDYDKGVITPNLINLIIKVANEKNIPVTVDPKHRNFNNYINCDLFKPNLKELTAGLKVDINKNTIREQLPDICNAFMKEKKHKLLMVTLSENGIFITNNKEWYFSPAKVRELADVSGAGDTVIAIATLALVNNLNMQDIANISNIAAGIVCEKVGVVPITKDELKKRLYEEIFTD